MTTYPVTFPTTIAPRETNFRLNRIIGVNESIYTASQQVYQYSGEFWEVDITMPPMRSATAREFVAFLVSLRGQYGSFYVGVRLVSTHVEARCTSRFQAPGGTC